MLRRLFAIYITIVLTAGPSLCCCTSLYAATPSSTAGSSSDHTLPCCCKDHCSAKVEEASGNPQVIDDKSKPDPKPSKHHCPCKDKGSKTTLDQTASSLMAQDVVRTLTMTFQYIVIAYTADPAVDTRLDSGVASPPGQRLTSWRLLNAPHMLRC